MSILPLPGLHRGVSFADYCEWDALNQGTLKRGPTMAHVKYAMDNPGPDDSDARRIGRALHLATLEPERFDAEFMLTPKIDGRTAEGKAAKAALALDPREKLDEAEHADVTGMAAAIRAHKGAMRILIQPGSLEVSMLWQDEPTGLTLKGRMDIFRPKLGVIADIKSTRNAEPWAFTSDIYKYGYHRQAALYLDGATACGDKSDTFILIAVESSAPYCVAVYALDAVALEVGRIENREALDKFAAAKKSGVWPAYPDTIEQISVPNWAVNRLDVDVESNL
jgi:hypothetical protein